MGHSAAVEPAASRRFPAQPCADRGGEGRRAGAWQAPPRLVAAAARCAGSHVSCAAHNARTMRLATAGRRGYRARQAMAGPPAPTADYDARRDFGRTPEPLPAPAAGGEAGILAADGTFVIHRHEARRLHYDLRMATDRVLVCWAVPRGFSYDPAVKHLAVHTEDHPLRYRTFEGVIPKGEYGAGTMLIWDTGSYEVLKADDLAAAIGAGEVKVVLRGRRLRGEWHLVRTRAGQSGNDEWLLFKARDRYSREPGEPAPPVIHPARTRPAPMPARPRAMAADGDHGQFSDPDWLFELEFDGLRTFAAVTGGEVAFMRPSGAPAAIRRPIRAAVERDFSAVRASQALLDGVLVALDRQGRPAREALNGGSAACDSGGDAAHGGAAVRADAAGDPTAAAEPAPPDEEAHAAPAGAPAAGAPAGTMAYYAFDLLHYDEWDLRGLPLVERKQFLRALLPPLPALLYADHVTASGESLAAVAAGAGFHGLIAKRAASSYRSGAHSDWRRVPLQASAGASEVEVHAALSAAASRQRKRTDVQFSNLGKVYWPAEGYTKGDLLAFYEQIADFLLPYLRDRPVHMKRFPDGIGGNSFFQRQAPAGVPDWVELVEVDARHTRQFICNDLRTLLYLVNLGSIELHPWLSRRGSLTSPDFAVLDLDAKETSFGNAVRVARTAGKVLRGIGLRPAIKTSGASGLHIYVALVAGYQFEQVRLFMEAVARVVARELPEIASVERLPRGRGGKVYVDFLQNRKSATVVPPYVARPVPGARVSMPLEWDELDGDLHPSRFSIANVPDIVARRGDLFRATLTDRQDFAPAIDRLQIYLAEPPS